MHYLLRINKDGKALKMRAFDATLKAVRHSFEMYAKEWEANKNSSNQKMSKTRH